MTKNGISKDLLEVDLGEIGSLDANQVHLDELKMRQNQVGEGTALVKEGE